MENSTIAERVVKAIDFYIEAKMINHGTSTEQSLSFVEESQSHLFDVIKFMLDTKEPLHA